MSFTYSRVIGLLALGFIGGCGDGEATTGNGGNGGSGGTSSGQPCGEAGVCEAGTFCGWHYGSCGKSPSDFTECVTVATGCGANDPPVCACDGNVYESYCDAVGQGVDVGETGSCTAPEGLFACGSKLCTVGEDFCKRQDVIDAINSSCDPLPSGCTACSCLLPGGQGGAGGGSSACTCTTDDGDLFVDCPASL